MSSSSVPTQVVGSLSLLRVDSTVIADVELSANPVMTAGKTLLTNKIWNAMLSPGTEQVCDLVPTPVQLKDVRSASTDVSMCSRDMLEVLDTLSGSGRYLQPATKESHLIPEAETTPIEREVESARSDQYGADLPLTAVDFAAVLETARAANVLDKCFTSTHPESNAFTELAICFSIILSFETPYIWFQDEDDSDHSPSWEWDEIFRIDTIYGRPAISCSQVHMRLVATRKRSYKTMGLGSSDIGE